MEYLFLIVSLLLTLLQDVNACSCFPTHIQDHYCRADYVIIATVKSVEDIYNNKFKQTNQIPEGPVYPYPIQRKFKARIHRVFKTNGNDTTPKDIVINTPGSDAACGISLDLKKKYIIGGYKVENDYWINLCGWVQEYRTLNRKQIKGIKFFYGKNCQCQISTCFNTQHCNQVNSRKDKKVCTWQPQWNNDCFVRHGVCSAKSDGSCYWKKNRLFKTCLQINDQKFPWKQKKSVEILPVVDHGHGHSPGYWP